jgi:hypothetical protein
LQPVLTRLTPSKMAHNPNRDINLLRKSLCGL